MNDREFADYVERVEACVAHLQGLLPFKPRTVIQLGTGLGDFVARIDTRLVLPYDEIPHFPRATVKSHRGNLVLGYLEGEPVAVLQGRLHFYEGYSTREVTFPVRVLSLLGPRLLVVTNAAGGINPLISPGTIMVIRDHLNFLGENPLRGPNNDSWGPRFPDLSTPYHPILIKTALDAAIACGLPRVISGVYACIPGPSLETPAETRWLRECGADAVGMSSVPEVIVARHAGMATLGLSVVSNVNDPDNFQPILLEDIIKTAGEVTPRLQDLMVAMMQKVKALPLQ
jgi:purine-nucleoside phosphorylase